jgi:uncharacterized protein (DUF1778 family)
MREAALFVCPLTPRGIMHQSLTRRKRLNLRLAEHEYEALERVSEREQVTVTDFIRTVVLEATRRRLARHETAA